LIDLSINNLARAFLISYLTKLGFYFIWKPKAGLIYR